MAFIEKYDYGGESSDEEIIDEKLNEIYRLFLTEWKEAWMIVEKQKKNISSLLMKK